jgi:hypothetical protein
MQWNEQAGNFLDFFLDALGSFHRGFLLLFD